MRKIEISLIKVQCIQFAANEGLRIDKLTDTEFIASSVDSVVNVDIQHLYTQYQQGWSVQDTLQNESCYNGDY